MKSIIERAFELAPLCSDLRQLRQMLKAEGYSQIQEHLSGLGTRRALSERLNYGRGGKKRGPQPKTGP